MICEPDEDEDLEEPEGSADPEQESGDQPGSEGAEDPDPAGGDPTDPANPRRRYIVDGVTVDVSHERVQYLDEHGKLITESLRDYARNRILDTYHSRDEFDLVCHVAFDEPPKTRRERAARLRETDYFSRYGETARAVVDATLDKYAADGITTIEDTAVLRLPPVSHLGGIKELVQPFGGTRDGFLAAIHELETELYREDDAGGAA